MPARKKTPSKSNPRASRTWLTYLLMAICTLILISGFFFAGRQHFLSIDFGMKNSRLKKQIEDLEAEKRRLLLLKEIAASPAEIKRVAKKTGLTDRSEQVTAVVAAARVTTDTPATSPASSKPLVIKTGDATPVALKTTAALLSAKTTSPDPAVEGKRLESTATAEKRANRK